MVAVLPVALAALCPAHPGKLTAAALFRNAKALPNKCGRPVGIRHIRQAVRIDIAEAPLIQAVKIAGINGAVPLSDKLVGTVATHAALLRRIAQVEMHPVVKLADAHVVAAHIVLDIGVEEIDKKKFIFMVRHIKIARGIIAKRAQARDKLKISEALFFEKVIDPVDIARRVPGDYRQDIKIHLMGLQRAGSRKDALKAIFAIRPHAKFVPRPVAVQTQADEEMILAKELRPRVIHQHAVGLQAEKYWTFAGIFQPDIFYEIAKIFLPCNQGFAALKGESDLLSARKCQRLIDQAVRRLLRHASGVGHIAVLGHIVVKAVFTPQVAHPGGWFNHDRQRGHSITSPIITRQSRGGLP